LTLGAAALYFKKGGDLRCQEVMEQARGDKVQEREEDLAEAPVAVDAEEDLRQARVAIAFVPIAVKE